MTTDIFNPTGTWMDKVGHELLMRFWEKKGCPGRLVLTGPWGVIVEYQSTPFGTIGLSVSNPALSKSLYTDFKTEMTRRRLRLPETP